jgi:hypothetical protein
MASPHKQTMVQALVLVAQETHPQVEAPVLCLRHGVVLVEAHSSPLHNQQVVVPFAVVVSNKISPIHHVYIILILVVTISVTITRAMYLVQALNKISVSNQALSKLVETLLPKTPVVEQVDAQETVEPLLVVQEEQEVEQPHQPLQNVLVQVDVLLVKYLTLQALKPHVLAVQTAKPLEAQVAQVAQVAKVETVEQHQVEQVDKTLPQ